MNINSKPLNSEENRINVLRDFIEIMNKLKITRDSKLIMLGKMQAYEEIRIQSTNKQTETAPL